MSNDLGDFEGLEGLEDRDFELSVEEVETIPISGTMGPCGSCAECATGSNPIGGDLENHEASLDIVEVQFKSNRGGFYVNESNGSLHVGSRVILEADRGVDLGTVVSVGETVRRKRRSRGLVGQPMRKVLRTVKEAELTQLEENRQIEEKAVLVFKEKCQKHNLVMKLTAVEYQFDRSRITFYFTADSRVDFRALVRDLAGVYRTRIELRQIGARDEARKVGGVGVCGREVCCSVWMTQIRRVTLDHARFQNLSLNPSRLAGACGRLKCCILFELNNYLEALKDFPPLSSKVVTAKGEGYIEKVDAFNCRVYLRHQGTGIVEALNLNEIKSYQIPNH
ncbi:MAG: Signal peptidase-like protein [Bacteroidetes bacterium]|nr:Signal peptidase-like protein [Bacteroidota bacterium]